MINLTVWSKMSSSNSDNYDVLRLEVNISWGKHWITHHLQADVQVGPIGKYINIFMSTPSPD